MNAEADPRRMAKAIAALLLAACAALGLARCRLAPEPEARPENYVTVRLNDSLSRFDSVVVEILSGGDTAAVVGSPWSGKLDQPGAIPSYRLPDGETGELSIRVRAWDANHRLVLDETIAKADGRQTVTARPIAQPSPRLLSLSLSAGTLTPAFAPGAFEYSASVPNAQVNVNVTAVPEYGPARIFVGARQAAAGQPSAAVPLDTGANRITLSVFAGDTSQQYVLAIRRAPAPADTVPPDTAKPPVPPPDTGLAAWKYKGLVVLRLPSPPAGTAGSLARDFPLLLRLDAGNFRFAEAADSGRDLRFFGPGGKPLDFAIARWDSLRQKAEIYIRCDTLAAGSEAPALLAYWGNPKAASASRPDRVFSPASGWTGVWHLEENATGRAGEFRDEAGGRNGTGGGAFPARTDGPVGYGQDFDGRGSQGWIAIPGDFDPGPGRFTLQTWIYNDGRNDAYVANKSGIGNGQSRFLMQISKGEGHFVFGRNEYLVTTGLRPTVASWQLLGVVCDGDSARFYLNGVAKETHAYVPGGNASAPVLLGARNPQGDVGFTGRLDEFWSFAGVRDAWYMELFYENQKPGSAMSTLTAY